MENTVSFLLYLVEIRPFLFTSTQQFYRQCYMFGAEYAFLFYRMDNFIWLPTLKSVLLYLLTIDTSQGIQMSERAQRLDQRNTSKDTAQTDTRLRNAHDDVPNPNTPSVCESRVEITGDQF